MSFVTELGRAAGLSVWRLTMRSMCVCRFVFCCVITVFSVIRNDEV